ncbi:uncharacterized protein LOC108622676 [Ceratina calcarata]|uniref:Uncharacterized protein LOC108622676 n=1 Tax=Ceratina calcarata TaxID=156304 RepID=A0AAJ7N4A2_9HYME|nr:uncharacterized protein LOC108622676 [Ceratina calcarata]
MMDEDQQQRIPNNVLLFRLAVSNSLKRIAELVSEEEFLKIFTIFKSKPGTAQKFHKAMCKELLDVMNDNLEEILTEGALQQELEKLAALTDANSSVKEDAWRPPGNVPLHLRSLDAQVMIEESETLEKRVNEIEKENAILMEQLSDKRLKVIAMNDKITRSLNKSPIVISLLEKRLRGLEECLSLIEHK